MTFLKRVQGTVASDGRRLCIFIALPIMLSLQKRRFRMEDIFLSSFDGQTFFTSRMPGVKAGSAEPCLVTVSVDGASVFSETLYPTGGIVTLQDLGELLEPYVRGTLVGSVTVSIGGASATATVLYAMVDVGVDASTFYSAHFLTILQGAKLTGPGRLEYLWYYGSDAASVKSEYSDGTEHTFSAVMATSNSRYSCIDASPSNYTMAGKTLVAYTVSAGERTQQYVVDPRHPDCAPILEFYNSFGVWEHLYCTGTHRVAPEYKRSTARIGGRLKQYKVEETRKFEADTGILPPAMAAWADELFRSDLVYVVNVYGGEVCSEDQGREVVITDSKSEVSNEDDDMPHFSFSYQYAQRIHNVLDMTRVGRIFDNTFDHTFN